MGRPFKRVTVRPGAVVEVTDYHAGLPKLAFVRRRRASRIEKRAPIMGQIDTELLVDKMGLKRASALLSKVGPELYVFNNRFNIEIIVAIEEKIGANGFARIAKALGGEAACTTLWQMGGDKIGGLPEAAKALDAYLRSPHYRLEMKRNLSERPKGKK